MKTEEVTARKQFQFLLENSNRPGMILEMDGTVVKVNKMFMEKFKVEKTGNIKELINVNSAGLWDEISILAKKNEGISSEMMITLKPTEMNTVKVKIRVIYCDVMEKLIALFDVPWGFQKEEGEKHINSFHKVDELMVLIDRNGVVCDINDLCQDFFGYPKSFFINKNIIEFLSMLSISTASYMENTELAIKNGFAKILKRYEKADGSVRYYQIATFFDAKKLVYILRITDKSEKIALREKLAHNDSLSVVGQLAASIAHEIRNPLTTLKGFTQLLKNNAEEDTMKYLNVIDDEIDRMETILNEMLVLSKPSQNKKNFISLQNLLSDIILLYSPKASIEGIMIERSEELISSDSIYGDEIKLKQALLNLLKNAAEAMTSGGVLTIGLLKSNNGQLIVTIEDNGKGMTSAELKEVFTPFFTTSPEGTGLGLSFVSEVMSDHGGKITVESKLNKGTKFTLSFPAETKHVPKGIVEERESIQLSI